MQQSAPCETPPAESTSKGSETNSASSAELQKHERDTISTTDEAPVATQQNQPAEASAGGTRVSVKGSSSGSGSEGSDGSSGSEKGKHSSSGGSGDAEKSSSKDSSGGATPKKSSEKAPAVPGRYLQPVFTLRIS